MDTNSESPTGGPVERLVSPFDFEYCQPIKKGDILKASDLVWGQHAKLPIEIVRRMSEQELESFKASARRHPPKWGAIPPRLIGMKSDSTLVDWRAFGRVNIPPNS